LSPSLFARATGIIKTQQRKGGQFQAGVAAGNEELNNISTGMLLNYTEV
jgi:hypothetical protein